MAPKITEFLTVRGMAKKATKNLVTFSAAPPGDKTCSTLVDEWRVVSTTTTTTICWPGHSSCLESSYRKSVRLAMYVIANTQQHSAAASHISVWTTSTRKGPGTIVWKKRGRHGQPTFVFKIIRLGICQNIYTTPIFGRKNFKHWKRINQQ